VKYRSVGVDGKAINVSGVVSLPKGKPPKNGWPVITYDHGTTGIADQCAPSRDSLSNPAHVYNSYAYPLLNRWLKAGYAVVRTDYQGLGTAGAHQYLVGVAEGRSTLDIVRAARKLDKRVGNRFAIAGHSQGGHAALCGEARAELDARSQAARHRGVRPRVAHQRADRARPLGHQPRRRAVGRSGPDHPRRRPRQSRPAPLVAVHRQVRGALPADAHGLPAAARPVGLDRRPRAVRVLQAERGPVGPRSRREQERPGEPRDQVAARCRAGQAGHDGGGRPDRRPREAATESRREGRLPQVRQDGPRGRRGVSRGPTRRATSSSTCASRG
jgi:hypothetical protein